MERRALVTGGAGFIGSHVTDALRAGGFNVEILDDFSSGQRDNVTAGTVVHEMSVVAPTVSDVVKEGRYSVICHLAAQIDVRRSVADPVFDATVNVLGTLNVAEAVRNSGRPTRIIFSSTGGALYGDFVTPPNVEEFPKDPESPYGIAKLSAEYYLAYYARVHGMDTVALRYANVYGPRQDPHGEAGVVAIFCNRILAGQPLTIFGDGAQTRDFVFVRDVANANVRAATRKLPPAGRLDARGFNIGTEDETTVNELAKVLLDAAGSSARVEHAPARPGEQQRSAVRIARARDELEWQPQTTLADGLAETYRWFASRHAAPVT